MTIHRRIGEILQRLFRPREPELPPEEAEQLTTLFKERYYAFRTLLAANRRALENMARMEVAHAGGQPYGMNFVVSTSNAIVVRVYRMIQNLGVLAPGKYGELEGRFNEIRAGLDAILDPPWKPIDAPLVAPLDAINRGDAAFAGGKMANLGEIAKALDLSVPRGFVITAAATRRLLDENELLSEIDRLIQSTEIDRPDKLFALSSQLQQRIVAAHVPDAVREAIERAMADIQCELGPEIGFAVRSSAIGEDTADTSFAGLYESELNVHPDNLVTAYVEIAASQFTPQAMTYRYHHGLRNRDTEMAVGCVAMVDARAGGVAYTADPQNPMDRRIRVSAAIGLPKSVVDGRFANDLFVIERDSEQIVDRQIGNKTTAFVLRPGEGITKREIDEVGARAAALDDEQVLHVARTACALESHFGEVQDVEWAFDHSGGLIVLQTRPMPHTTAPPRTPTIDGEPLVSGGVCVSPGIGSGRVQWVRSDREALKMPDGAVLVLSHPDPRWAALLDRATAVVSERGGIAGHLATVAREYGVPALFGVGSLEVLSRDAEVTVDASGLAIHPGIRASLHEPGSTGGLMDGSPIQAVLGKALELTTPLNLLDPSSREFHAANVRTLHDITRFCHEMSVREMFAFGRDHEFPRYAAKQLHHNVPMQWWVLDLDDGFAGEVRGKYVKLDQINCSPMKVLWDGMVAVPWDGPPAMSGSGFASVLFEATRNPALSTPFKKPYAQRNYFMISANFMNLQSRFGFHFSTVETLAGERDDENYLVFSLKGGAADLERRAGRATLVADLLSERGFRVQVIEDTMTARAWAMPAEDILQRVKIVGYLLMHTRQLDMVMGRPSAVEHYRRKLHDDIDTLGGR